MFCRHCGNQLPDEAKFCNKCGTPTKSIPAPPVAEEPKQETTAPVTVVTAQPVVEVAQTAVAMQAPPAQEIIEPAPAPVEPEPVPVIPEPISEPEPVPEPISDPMPEPVTEPEPPAVAPVVPEDIPAAEPVRAETVQAPPVVEPPAVPDPVPVAEIEETPVEPIVSIAEAPVEEPDKTVPDNRCPNCQCEITPGVKFCPECGSAIIYPPAPAESAPTEPDDRCPNCRAEITPGIKFCPECGNTIVRRVAVEEKPSEPVPAAPSVSASKPLTFRAYLSRMSTKAKIVIGSVAIIVVILLLCLLGENYDPALVEAKNSYGLSTTVTLDEAIALYNEYIAVMNNIEKGSDYEWHLWVCGGITDKKDLTVSKDTENGLTQYAYRNPFSYAMGESGIDWGISFVIDSETGYLVYVRLVLERDKLDNASEANLEGINEKYWALVYALANGDMDTANKIKAMESWENGWFKGADTPGNGYAYLYAGCGTKEFFEENS